MTKPNPNKLWTMSRLISTIPYSSARRKKHPKFKNTKLAIGLLLLSGGTAHADVMLGASLPNDGFSPTVISDFNGQSAKPLAFVNVFSAFSHDWDNLYWQSSNVVAEGAMPMISWMPIDLNRRDDNLLPEIAVGLWDDYLDLWGTKLLAWVNSYPETERPRLSIRFAHEFNGNWYPYSNTPVMYQEAWQHIHNKFEDMGVNAHVDWVWSISKTSYDDHDNVSLYYPGDQYVDWTAIDGYNWGSNYISGGWTSFGDIMVDAYNHMVTNYPSKPIMISETGSAEPHDLPNTLYGMYGDDSDANESKPTWVAGMLNDLEFNFPAVRALALFNINKELRWSLNESTNTGLNAWNTGTQSEYFTSEFIVASAELQMDVPVLDEALSSADPEIIISDSLEADSDDASSGNKGNAKGKGKKKNNSQTETDSNQIASTEKISESNTQTNRRSNKKVINQSEQVKLASSRASYSSKAAEQLAKRKNLANLPEQARQALARVKLAVIDY